MQSGILHVTVLTTDGRVFQWGEICSNEERQVGVCELSFLSGSYKNEKERVIQIACGENHALALTAKGQVYSWGRDDDGQLGIKRDAHIHVAGPTHVSGLRWPISQIACGDWTSYALEVDGSVSGFFKLMQFLLLKTFRPLNLYCCCRCGVGVMCRMMFRDMAPKLTQSLH